MARKATYVCSLCAETLLYTATTTPRCRKCRIRMVRCGGIRDFSRISRLHSRERLQLANSDDQLPERR